MATTKILSLSILIGVCSFLPTLSITNQPVNAAVKNFASLSEGATLIGWSSQYTYAELGVHQPINGGVDTARNNLLTVSKTAWLNNGETGFIFGNGDRNQRLIIDLGQTRSIDQIGALLSPYPNDREVWDYFEVRTSLDNVNYTPWGIIGAKDGAVDITASSNFINQLAQPVRYIEYGFGRYSFENYTVDQKQFSNGSRVLTLYANQTIETPTSVPEPSTVLTLLGFGTFGVSSLLKRKRQQKVLDSVVSN